MYYWEYWLVGRLISWSVTLHFYFYFGFMHSTESIGWLVGKCFGWLLHALLWPRLLVLYFKKGERYLSSISTCMYHRGLGCECATHSSAFWSKLCRISHPWSRLKNNVWYSCKILVSCINRLTQDHCFLIICLADCQYMLCVGLNKQVIHMFLSTLLVCKRI